jgi:isobutyryl-CoA mutase
LIRSTEEEKGQQIENVRRYKELRNALGHELPHSVRPDPSTGSGQGTPGGVSKDQRGATDNQGLTFLQQTARARQNVFAALMEAVKAHSLGQISHALYDVGGEYRRNM